MTLRAAWLLSIAPLAGACVGLHGYDSMAELRADAVAVFRSHNQTAGAVMLALPELDQDSPATRQLAAADAVMLAACEPLNELAVARRDGRKVSLRQRRRLPETIADCRHATQTTRDLLDALPPAP